MMGHDGIDHSSPLLTEADEAREWLPSELQAEKNLERVLNSARLCYRSQRIESVGALKPGVILAEALRILKMKCHNVIRMADESLEVEGLNE